MSVRSTGRAAHQSAPQYMMIRPAVFAFNPETRRTNHFQHAQGRDAAQIYAEAMREFAGLHDLYRRHDIDVLVFESDDAHAPDAIFPNCISTFPPGVFDPQKPGERHAILHPMLELSRRRERSPALLSFLSERLGYRFFGDLSDHEKEGRALEGTGSMVLDHVHRRVFAGLSGRTDAALVEEFSALCGYRPVIFETADAQGQPIYHTDVLMYVATSFIGICLECILPSDRARVEKEAGLHHQILAIDAAQLSSFCGNALQVRNRKGDLFLAMSGAAFGAMRSAQKNIVESQGVRIIHADIPTIERIGGGSVRCMTQELF